MFLVDLLFPKNCLECGRKDDFVCPSCINRLKNLKQICPYCEKPSVDGVTHAKCVRSQGLDGLVSLWPYEGVVRKALLALKYKFAKQVAEELVSYILVKLKKSEVALVKEAVLIPIPLYWYRENFRGFNQSEEIGKVVSQKMGWGFIADLLIRKRLARPQTELKGDERSKNIRGVFAINEFYKSLITSHQSLIVFDDVYTTGSTLKEACKVLKRKGARQVWGLTITR